MYRRHLIEDLILVLVALVAAWAIVRFGLVHALLAQMGDGVWATSFVAVMFFTSLVTTPPAIAVLGGLAQEGNMVLVALLGGLGAVVGDYILFAFVRDRVSADAAYLLRGPKVRRALHVFKNRHFRRVLPIVGALIIASPLPDELGLTLLGLSHLRTKTFFFVSFTMNALGILAVGLIARSAGW